MPGLHGWVPANTCWLVGLVGHPQRRRNYYFYSPSRRRRRRKRKKVSTSVVSTSFSLCGRTVSFCLSSSSKVSTAAVAILLIHTTTNRREREWRGLLLSPSLRIYIGGIPQYCVTIVPKCKSLFLLGNCRISPLLSPYSCQWHVCATLPPPFSFLFSPRPGQLFIQA